MSDGLLATGTFTALDVRGAVDLLEHYLQELDGHDEPERGRVPSVARLQALLNRAAGDDAIVDFHLVAGRLSVVLNVRSLPHIERIIRLLAIVGAGRITAIGEDEVQRYLLRGGTAFVQRGRLALSTVRPMSGW
jgi:hypothetical protein